MVWTWYWHGMDIHFKAKSMTSLLFAIAKPQSFQSDMISCLFRVISCQCHIGMLLKSCEWGQRNEFLFGIDWSFLNHHSPFLQNQFFITSLKSEYVFNKIGDALVDRICEAHEWENIWKFSLYLGSVHTRWVRPVSRVISLGWVDFQSVFMWSNIYLENEPASFSIQASTTFGSAKTKIQKKLAQLDRWIQFIWKGFSSR